MSAPPAERMHEYAAAIRARMAGQSRTILGIAGPPGSGKSTFAERLRACFHASEAVIVPMDGFHLAQSIIQDTPLATRKGAPDTFDVGGYVALLRRLRANDEPVVYAPTYRRGLEEPIAASVAVTRDVPLLITEGNYLLADLPGWREVLPLLDDAWFVDTPDELRVPGLISRHIAFGMDATDAERWANGPDADNARLVASTRSAASRVIAWPLDAHVRER
jgi:pantothenate kinase